VSLPRLKLPSGIRYAYGLNNERICVGAQMGRQNVLPEYPNNPTKLRLVRLRWVDGDYDVGGAYWGNSGATSIYWASGDGCQVFVRAAGRDEAKELVREKVPGAKFFR
jgi:hypothetical protein